MYRVRYYSVNYILIQAGFNIFSKLRRAFPLSAAARLPQNAEYGRVFKYVGSIIYVLRQGSHLGHEYGAFNFGSKLKMVGTVINLLSERRFVCQRVVP